MCRTTGWLVWSAAREDHRELVVAQSSAASTTDDERFVPGAGAADDASDVVRLAP